MYGGDDYQARLNDLVAVFRELPEEGAELSKDEARQKRRLCGKLDDLLWERIYVLAEEQGSLDSDELSFRSTDRLVADGGLLDPRLVRGDHETVKEGLMKELYAFPKSGVYYLTEWLADRYRTAVEMSQLGEEDEKSTQMLVAALASDDYYRKLAKARTALYKRLKQFMTNLPGVPPKAAELISSGRLDADVDVLVMKLKRTHDLEIRDRIEKLVLLRDRIIARAKKRCRIKAQLTLFDTLEEAQVRISEHLGMGAIMLELTDEVEKGLEPEARSQFLRDELKLVRSLIRIGSAAVTPGGGPHTVVTQSGPRATKREVIALSETVGELDPRMPGMPRILIAPYAGGSFFEWDRDTLFVPLAPNESVADAFVKGMANYRVMVDTLHYNGGLKAAYLKAHPDAAFPADFVEHYHTWVTKFAAGQKASLGEGTIEFFKEQIGPNPQAPPTPIDLMNLTPQEIRQGISKYDGILKTRAQDFDANYHAGVLYWKSGHTNRSLERFQSAEALKPKDARVHYALGVLYKRLYMLKNARDAFQASMINGRGTLWSLYAADALRNV